MFEGFPVQVVMQLITTHTDFLNQKKKKKKELNQYCEILHTNGHREQRTEDGIHWKICDYSIVE